MYPETPACSCRGFEPQLGNDIIAVCAIDPSWVTGMVIIEANRRHAEKSWPEGIGQTANIRIVCSKVTDVSKKKLWSVNEKIMNIVADIERVLEGRDVNVIAIETPFVGTSKIGGVPDYKRSFRSSAAINQGRLFQGLVDFAVLTGRYSPSHSEIHNSQAKAAVIRAIGVKKEAVRETIERIYQLHWMGKMIKPHKEAVTDAISIGLGYVHLAHPEIPIPTVVFKK